MRARSCFTHFMEEIGMIDRHDDHDDMGIFTGYGEYDPSAFDNYMPFMVTVRNREFTHCWAYKASLERAVDMHREEVEFKLRYLDRPASTIIVWRLNQGAGVPDLMGNHEESMLALGHEIVIRTVIEG